MKNEKTNIKSYIKQFYKGNVICLMVALCASLLMSIGSLIVSWLLQQVIDLVSGYDTGFTLTDLLGIAIMLVVGIVVVEMLSYHFVPRFITRGISQYKEFIFRELSKKNISAFSEESSSTYISALTNDIQTIEQGYLRNTFTMIESLLTFAGAIVLMLWYSPILTLVAAGFSLLPIVAVVLTGNKMAQAEKSVSDKNEMYTSTLKDSLGGFSVMKSFKAEAQVLRIFKDIVKNLAKAQCKREKTKILVKALSVIAGVVTQFGVFIVGAYFALSGKGITAGTIIIFVQLMNYIIAPIGAIPTCLAERNAAKALVGKIAVTLNTNVREEVKMEHKELEHSIEINNLSFGYDAEKQILNNINYSFEVGKKYAIVGASGSGKSTLLNLMMASHSDYSGSIYYDDVDMREIRTESLYDMVSVIQQNVFIFSASIRDNITMFSEFPREEVERAIQLSGLSKLIAERGEDYICGENGSGLSGGEKQRISIARSLLKKSQILLVDEATAALDAQTAFQVSNAILNLKGVTCIVVTHSLDESLLKQYDGILTLKNGAIEESGTFDELMEKKGYFYSLYTVSQ
ncbi:MAG: ABC transporter ATP-binding protein [Clostridia bacterium]|nr:ABC transporter ATP-binding protein [Clostridia bacterium]